MGRLISRSLLLVSSPEASFCFFIFRLLPHAVHLMIAMGRRYYVLRVRMGSQSWPCPLPMLAFRYLCALAFRLRLFYLFDWISTVPKWWAVLVNWVLKRPQPLQLSLRVGNIAGTAGLLNPLLHIELTSRSHELRLLLTISSLFWAPGFNLFYGTTLAYLILSIECVFIASMHSSASLIFHPVVGAAFLHSGLFLLLYELLLNVLLRRYLLFPFEYALLHLSCSILGNLPLFLYHTRLLLCFVPLIHIQSLISFSSFICLNRPYQFIVPLITTYLFGCSINFHFLFCSHLFVVGGPAQAYGKDIV